MTNASRSIPDTSTPFWRNEKWLALLMQAALVIMLLALFWFLISNMQARLASIKNTSGLRFNFLNNVAGFEIGEGISFSPQESFGRAFIVGIVNTLRVSFIGIILSTLLGLFAGIARLSNNWLVSRLAGFYIEVIRNTPLLLQLFFWYFGVILALPDIKSPLNLGGLAILTNRGIALATIHFNNTLLPIIDRPVRHGFSFDGGTRVTPEFAGLLLGLVVFTGAFIAEIVRAGITSVSEGQWDAARAVGLSGPAILRLVVLPQALRVIIPPLTNQYLNLLKNSSLAVAIGYPDLFNVSMTILSQTGAEVQIFFLVIATYLFFSLITSLLMNWYNHRVAFSQG